MFTKNLAAIARAGSLFFARARGISLGLLIMALASSGLALETYAQTQPNPTICKQRGGLRDCVAPNVGEYVYTFQRCDAEQPASSEQDATTRGAAYYYGSCSDQRITRDGPWPTPAAKGNPICGGGDLSFPKVYLGIEAENGKSIEVEYCQNAGVWLRDTFAVWRRRPVTCPDGYDGDNTEGSPNFGLCVANVPTKCISCCSPEGSCGNPINTMTFNKIETATDIRVSDTPLAFTRSYNSLIDLHTGRLGKKWRHSLERTLDISVYSASGVVTAVREDGRKLTFWTSATGLTPDLDISDRLVVNKTGSVVTGWTYKVAADDSVEQYDATGRLLSHTSRAGPGITLQYSDATTPIAIAPAAGLLINAVDTYGRTIALAYDAKSRVVKVTGPDGGNFLYAYNGTTNDLVSVTYPDNKTRTYVYNETAWIDNGASFPSFLTGIVDEHGQRYSNFRYYSNRWASMTEHAGGVSRYTLSNNDTAGGYSQVTGPLGTLQSLARVAILGVPKLLEHNEACPNCTNSGLIRSGPGYDVNGNVNRRSLANGNYSEYTFDLTRNLETRRVEGLRTNASTDYVGRTIDTTWHPTFRLPATITEPTSSGNKVTTNTYDVSGNLLQRDVTVGGATRTWKWTYNAVGRVATATDPRGKITTYAYYPNTTAQHAANPNSRGMLNTVTNAAGHLTTFNSYNAYGQPLSITDANGLTTTMSYDSRQRLIAQTTAGVGISETMTYDYDAAGQLTRVTLADGSKTYYAYDAAHRLVGISDDAINATPVNGALRITTVNLAGSKILYTLDNMGNRIEEFSYDPTGALARQRKRIYDAMGRLEQETNGLSLPSKYRYDTNGNPRELLDPLNRLTAQPNDAFDALDRMVKSTDTAGGLTLYEYDLQNNLTKVTDPKGLSTTYTYNGFNEVLTQLSPDTGTTSFSYDATGNLTQKTDARGATAKYVYDALNRVTQTKFYPTLANANANTSSDETRTYTYDTGCSTTATGSTANTKGRLCTLTDKAGTTTFGYDLKGRITAKSQLVSTLTQSHSYRYNSAGQMDQWTTASGQLIGYTYANNKVSGITVNGQALISNVLYDPFGPPVGWLWPSATTPNLKTYRDYDLDGRLTRWELKNGVSYIQRDVVWDDANRVTQLKDLLTTPTANPNNPQTFAYDNLDRLTTTNLGAATTPSQVLAYDAIGNRTSATINGILSTYNYPSPVTSHRLTSTTGGTNPRTFTYNAMGNLTNDGKYTYTYWNNGRINTVTWVTGTAPNTTTNTATYNINAMGQRARKVTPSNVVGTRRFMYDEAGHLTGEYDSAGKLIQETVWFGDIPIATLRPKAGSTTTPIQIDIFYVHSDHLNTPRVITRPSDNKIVWSNENTEAFGNSTVNENPSALGAFKYNLRLGGWQQYEQETGLFQNTNRDLDPALGRYVQSDPIGLAAGPNTYAYVGGSPLSKVDPYGLFEGNIGDYLKPAVSACVRASTIVVASTVALAVGIGSYSGDAGNACSDDVLDKNDTCNPEKCEQWKRIAQRQFDELTRRSIPQYMWNSRNGSADLGHYNAILELKEALKDSLRRVAKYCNPLPSDYARWKQIADEPFPMRGLK
jgi:RHS repeat-associated protein